jgi:hypothetical protein
MEKTLDYLAKPVIFCRAENGRQRALGKKGRHSKIGNMRMQYELFRGDWSQGVKCMPLKTEPTGNATNA